MLASAAVTRLALLPAFVHAFGTIGTIEPGSGTNEPCKLVEPASWAQIDFEEFTRASWFGQEQEVTPFQPLDEFFCLVATYKLEGKVVQVAGPPFGTGAPFDGTVISAYNQGNKGSVDGAKVTEQLCARDLEPENNRLAVAPCFLPNSLAGPYWPVILKADKEGRYTAMAVINGQPTVPKSDGCGLPPESEGLFILTRDRIAPPELVKEMKAELVALGISVAKLLPVTKEGCAFEGFDLKPSNEVTEITA